MQNLSLRVQVPDGALHLSRQFQEPLEELSDAVAHYLEDAYKYYSVVVGAVDTGEHLFSIHVEEGPSGGDEYQKYVVASSGHSMVIEIGWTERAKGQASYPGRFPAEKAVEFLIQGLESGRVQDALSWRLGR